MLKWYHIVECQTDPYITIKPKIPEGVLKGEDTTTPRVSVAPSLKHCLASLTGLPHPYLSLYQYIGTEKPIPAYKEVPDTYLTHEHWLLKTSRFKFVSEVVVHGSLGLKRVKDILELEALIKEVLNAKQTREKDGRIHLWDAQTWTLRPIILGIERG